MQFRYDFSVSELLLRVESPRELKIPEPFRAFFLECPQTQSPDILIQFLFPSNFEQIVAEDVPNAKKFDLGGGEYVLKQESSGRGSPCRIFIPPSMGDSFVTGGNWLLFMELNRLVLPFDRYFLHASGVVYRGKAYLFSAPSGGGKSTHAALWQQHFGAKLLNGDKVLIEVRDGQCIAHGSPVAGSSGIYERDSAPIAAVYLLKKEKQNRVYPVSPREALLSLYSQAIKENNDPAFNTKLLDLIGKTLSSVPVRCLGCLPEKSAVECVMDREGI